MATLDAGPADPRPDRPVLLLLQGVRSAFGPARLATAAAGLLLLQAGWDLLDATWPDSAGITPHLVPPSARFAPDPGSPLASIGVGARLEGWRLTEPVRLLAGPLAALFTPGRDGAGMVHALLAVLWAVAVWGIAGGSLARRELLTLARPRPGTSLGPFRFPVRFAASLIATPLHPLLVALLLGATSAGLGLVARLPAGIGSRATAVLFVVPLLLGLGMAVLLLGMLAGWGLFHAAIAAESEVSLEALGRCLSYLGRRPGQFAACLAFAWAVGVPALMLVDLLDLGVLHLASWGPSLTAPGPVAIPCFWEGLTHLLSHSWIHAYFWGISARIYLILRHDVDRTPWTVVDPASGGTQSRSR